MLNDPLTPYAKKLMVTPIVSAANYNNNLMKLQEKYHKDCLFNLDEFKTENYFDDDGSVMMHFFCNEKYRGYDEMMHGGMISALIDSAMTKCLFGHRVKAYTARLNIKYLRPVKINNKLTIKVLIKENKSEQIALLNASLLQDNYRSVTANAKFWIIENIK